MRYIAITGRFRNSTEKLAVGSGPAGGLEVPVTLLVCAEQYAVIKDKSFLSILVYCPY